MSKVEDKLERGYVNNLQHFEQFFYQNKDYVKYLAHKKCNNPNDADDIIQRTWEMLLRNFHKLLHVPDNKLCSYISAVMTNIINMEARKKKPNICSIEDVCEPGYDPIPFLDQCFEQNQVKEIFRSAWPKIDPCVREILERRYILDQSIQEIAKSMQIAPNNVYTYLHRARKIAKRELLKQNKYLDQQWRDAYT